MLDQRRVLIVRIWWEHDLTLAVPVMRGSLQQLGSPELRYFDSFEALLMLMQTGLAAPQAQNLAHPSTSVESEKE